MTDDLSKYREIVDISFDDPGSHLALTHRLQGYSANNKPQPLIIKQAKTEMPIEAKQVLDVLKGGDVRITLPMKDFLTRFMGMYYEDAEILCRVLGYETDMQKEDEPWSYDKYIEEKVSGIELLKSAIEKETIPAKNYIQINKLMKEIDLEKQDSPSEGNPPQVNNEENPSENGEINKMSQELIEKAAKAEELLKAKEQELEKALVAIEKMKQEENARIEKAYTDMTSTFTFVEEGKRSALVKALLGVSEDNREVVVAAFEKAQEMLKAAIEKEHGYEGDAEVAAPEKLQKALNERIAEKYKSK